MSHYRPLWTLKAHNKPLKSWKRHILLIFLHKLKNCVTFEKIKIRQNGFLLFKFVNNFVGAIFVWIPPPFSHKIQLASPLK